MGPRELIDGIVRRLLMVPAVGIPPNIVISWYLKFEFAKYSLSSQITLHIYAYEAHQKRGFTAASKVYNILSINMA